MLSSVAARLVCASSLVAILLLPGCHTALRRSPVLRVNADQVGRIGQDRFTTPTGQLLTPSGLQIELPGMRPQVLALSPDGKLLATAGKTTTLVLLDPATGERVQNVPLTFIHSETKPQTNSTSSSAAGGQTNRATTITTGVTNKAEVSCSGLIFSPRGDRLYFSDVGGKVWLFRLQNGRVVGDPLLFPLPDAEAPKQRKEVPGGLAISPDDQRLYVVGNLGNRLHELDATNGKPLRSWDTGVAPYDVVLVGHKAYVSNEGGRRPGSRDLTALAGKGTKVRVDPVRHIANEGSVTVIDLVAGQVRTELLVGLHPTALTVSPDARFVVVANTGSDTLNVIDVQTDCVVEKIWARQTAADLFGAQPNAVAFAPDGRRLYVCNGTQNAVAVVRFEPRENASRVEGLIPVGWFPAAVRLDASRKTLCIANLKGVGATRAFKNTEKIKLHTRDYLGTVSLVPVPSNKQLPDLTAVAERNMRYPRIQEALEPPRSDQPPRPVPERAGEPSVFKHVIYVIKENRSYDQVLGDMKEGNGDSSLCTFGERYTPNQHKIAREFVLLDNTYCSGVCSTDGHQWTDSGLANDYVERQFTSGNPRSYSGAKDPDAVDGLSWASSGFIWTHALAAGKTFRNYGEWMLSQSGWKDPKRKESIYWRDYWKDYTTGAGLTQLRSHAGPASLRNVSCTNTVGWDLKVPDVMRAAEFIRELRAAETNGGLPQLTLLFLPNDHTGGTRADYPTPGAQVADNDLAFGYLVEALTHSKFWADTCLLAIEDDPQSGWDHVSGYRTTCYVVSPYTKRRQTVSTQYNHTSLLRTIELILGLPPMNQLDAAATPMTDCFTSIPDLTPFTSVANRVPLDQINPEPKKVADRRVRRDALLSARLPLDEVDQCPEDLFNRILWRAMKGPDTPYPEWAIKAEPDDD